MVSYCNSLAMYRHQQQGPAPGWYGPPSAYQAPHQVSQQYISCMQDAGAEQSIASWHHPHAHPHAPHPVFQGDWSPSPGATDYMHHQHSIHGLHQHPLQQHLPSDHADPILPSPPMTVSGSDMSSPSGGTGTASPPQTSSRPLPARSPYEWMKKPSYQTQPNPGKTRTKDKYRVVYSDHQRLELEKEFHYSRYITIRRKAELAASLGLSERQVKIWFQNRRAKERKQVKKREEMDLSKVKLEDLQHPHHHHPLLHGPVHHQQVHHSQHHHQSLNLHSGNGSNSSSGSAGSGSPSLAHHHLMSANSAAGAPTPHGAPHAHGGAGSAGPASVGAPTATGRGISSPGASSLM